MSKENFQGTSHTGLGSTCMTNHVFRFSLLVLGDAGDYSMPYLYLHLTCSCYAAMGSGIVSNRPK